MIIANERQGKKRTIRTSLETGPQSGMDDVILKLHADTSGILGLPPILSVYITILPVSYSIHHRISFFSSSSLLLFFIFTSLSLSSSSLSLCGFLVPLFSSIFFVFLSLSSCFSLFSPTVVLYQSDHPNCLSSPLRFFRSLDWSRHSLPSLSLLIGSSFRPLILSSHLSLSLSIRSIFKYLISLHVNSHARVRRHALPPLSMVVTRPGRLLALSNAPRHVPA